MQASQSPGALAMYHERLMDILVRVILGFNPTTRQPYPGGGIFGFCRAFAGSDEDQARLALHRHLLAWIFGHDKLMQRMRQPGAVERLQRYIY